MEVKSRHHLRGDEIDEIVGAIEAALGVSVEGDSFEDVAFTDSDRRVVLVDGEPYVAFFGGEPFLTVNGAQTFAPTSRVVTVDAGAISFVSDGADVMRPGITEADEEIAEGDLVAVAEETHGKVLAVGRALVDGSEMTGDSGKVVKSLHHVGDELFEFRP
jgi:PUA domain protein